MAKGYVHVYTGDGKGKTTAALGLSLRAAGAGLKVLFIQFAKKKRASEHCALERFADCITVKQFGTQTFISGTPSAEDTAQACAALQEARQALQGGTYDMVVLDEACFAMKSGMIAVTDMLDAIRARHENVEVVVTGRNAPRELCEEADLITEMKLVKHYFDNGVTARKGIEE